jgi:hypothetical protein
VIGGRRVRRGDVAAYVVTEWERTGQPPALDHDEMIDALVNQPFDVARAAPGFDALAAARALGWKGG